MRETNLENQENRRYQTMIDMLYRRLDQIEQYEQNQWIRMTEDIWPKRNNKLNDNQIQLMCDNQTKLSVLLLTLYNLSDQLHAIETSCLNEWT